MQSPQPGESMQPASPKPAEYLSPMPQADRQYLIHKNGQQFGPYDLAKVLENLKNGHFTLDDQTWIPGLEGWEPLRYHISTQDLTDYGISGAMIKNPNGSPIHIQTALVVMALDGFWGVVELGSIGAAVFTGGLTIITMLLLCFVVGAVAYFVVKNIQEKSAGDTPDEAKSKALTMAVLCGVPFPFLGTATGTFFLAWAGLRGSKVKLPGR